jgi:sn-glycerol 3-phosphate transport system permease protein
MAGAVIVLIPSIIIFIISQKQIVKGMTAGAVKG